MYSFLTFLASVEPRHLCGKYLACHSKHALVFQSVSPCYRYGVRGCLHAPAGSIVESSCLAGWFCEFLIVLRLLLGFFALRRACPSMSMSIMTASRACAYAVCLLVHACALFVSCAYWLPFLFVCSPSFRSSGGNAKLAQGVRR